MSTWLTANSVWQSPKSGFGSFLILSRSLKNSIGYLDWAGKLSSWTEHKVAERLELSSRVIRSIIGTAASSAGRVVDFDIVF